MSSWQLASLAVWATSFAACGKSEPDPAPAPAPAPVDAPSAPAADQPDGATAGDGQASDDEAEKARKARERSERRVAKAAAACGDVINKTWAAASVAVARMGIEITPELEAEFREYPPLLADCARLKAPDRDCLLAGPNPLARLTVCKVRLSTFDFGQRIPEVDPTLTDVQKAELQKWLEGTWKNAHDGRETRWTIGPDGTVTASAVLKDGKPVETAPRPVKVAIERKGELVLHWPSGDINQTMSFERDGRDAFYATNRRLRIQEVTDRDHFVLRDQGRWVRWDDGKCEVVLDVGASLEGACTFAKEDGLELFKIESQLEGARNPTNSAFVVQGKRFIPRALFDDGRFERQKGGSQ